MAVDKNKKIWKFSDNFYSCSFNENIGEIIEFEIVIEGNKVYMHYCNHLYLDYIPNDIPKIRSEIYNLEEKFSPVRREVRNIRKIIDDEDNKKLLGDNYNLVNDGVKELEECFYIKDKDYDDHYYDFVIGNEFPVKTNFEILRKDNKYKVIMPGFTEKVYDEKGLKEFFENRIVRGFSDSSNNQAKEEDLFKEKDIKQEQRRAI